MLALRVESIHHLGWVLLEYDISYYHLRKWIVWFATNASVYRASFHDQCCGLQWAKLGQLEWLHLPLELLVFIVLVRWCQLWFVVPHVGDGFKSLTILQCFRSVLSSSLWSSTFLSCPYLPGCDEEDFKTSIGFYSTVLHTKLTEIRRLCKTWSPLEVWIVRTNGYPHMLGGQVWSESLWAPIQIP